MAVLVIRSWRHAVLICTFPVAYYLVVGRGHTVFVRYVDPIVPFLCLTAAVAVVDLTRRLVRSPRMAATLAAAGALLIALPSIQRVVAFDRLAATPDTRLVAAWPKPAGSHRT